MERDEDHALAHAADPRAALDRTARRLHAHLVALAGPQGGSSDQPPAACSQALGIEASVADHKLDLWRSILNRGGTPGPAAGPGASGQPCDARAGRAVRDTAGLPVEVQHIMGMPISVEIRDGDADVQLAFAWLRQVDAIFSTYREDSEISRLDRGEVTLADCRPVVDEVLTRCLALQRETRGYFHVRAAGRLDPSGFVKGWAVARAADLLAAAGARDFCIDAGGDVVARGRRRPGEPWRIGVRHPLRPARLAAVLAVEDVAVATSGAYERGPHVLDPHSGRPPSGLLSVTIAGPDLGTADAYATAAFAMGSEGPRWAASLRDYEALCITTGERVLSTPGLERLRVPLATADAG